MRSQILFGTTYKWLKSKDALRAAFYYVLILAVVFGSVVFLGRSLQAPLYYPHGLIDAGQYGYQGPYAVNTFSVEMATPSYYEWPTNVLVGNAYKEGDLPLWNPYQAAGTPLAAQYSSRSFFPYQVLQDISPVSTWDFFMLGRLFIAGFFTYLFLRRRGLSWISSFLGGIFFMLSGTFIWFINLEQFVNVAMVTPILLWGMEGLWHRRWGLSIPLAALGIALVLLAGQPETALYVLLLGAAYTIFRIFNTPGKEKFIKLGQAAAAAVLGLCITATLILPFLEFMPLSHSIHPVGGTMGTQDPTKLVDLPQMFVPTFNEMREYYRYFPDNGRWDYLGGYTGVMLPLLILTGLFTTFFRHDKRWRGYFLFFTIFGVLVLLKNFGSPLVSWIGRLPIFDLAWTNRWAGPAWTFPLAVAGAYGLEILKDYGASIRQKPSIGFKQRILGWLRNPTIYGYIILAGLVIFISIFWLPKWWQDSYSAVMNSPYLLPSVIFGFIAAVLVIIVALSLIKHAAKTKTVWSALILLAVLELWFAVPRGYAPETATLKIIPFLFGILIVLGAGFYPQWKAFFKASVIVRTATVVLSVVIFLASILGMEATASNGFPRRYNAGTIPPYVNFLKNQEGYFRVTGGDNALFPNFAQVAELQDVHYILALSIESFQQFKDQNLHIDRLSAPGGPVLWFTGGPEREVEGPEGHGIRIYRNHWEDIVGKLPYYSLLGVKYIVTPSVPETIPHNYLHNGDFSKWSLGPGPFTSNTSLTADNWVTDLSGQSAIKVSQNTQNVTSGTANSMQIDFKFQGVQPSYVKQVFENPAGFLGKTITFSAQIRTTEPEAVRIGISDPVSGPDWSVNHPGGDQWYTFIVNHEVPDSGVSNVAVLIQLSASATMLISNSSLIQGTDPSPLFANARTKGFPLVYNKEVAIYENPSAFPRAFIAQKVKMVDSLSQAQETITNANFNLRNEVVLEEPLPDGFTLAPESSSTVNITDYGLNNVVLQANMEKPGIMVLTDVYYPGWKATVDGKEQKILRVDGVFRGLALKEGVHDIVFSYMPGSFIHGIIFSGAGIIVCIGMLVIALMQRKRQHNDNNNPM